MAMSGMMSMVTGGMNAFKGMMQGGPGQLMNQASSAATAGADRMAARNTLPKNADGMENIQRNQMLTGEADVKKNQALSDREATLGASVSAATATRKARTDLHEGLMKQISKMFQNISQYI
jgi:hypothetical protein